MSATELIIALSVVAMVGGLVLVIYVISGELE